MVNERELVKYLLRGCFFSNVEVLRETYFAVPNQKFYNLLLNIFVKVTKIRKIGQDQTNLMSVFA